MKTIFSKKGYTYLPKMVMAFFLICSCADRGFAGGPEAKEEIELLELDVLSYDEFIQNNPETLNLLNRALHEKGIVGIAGIPGYVEKVRSFIESARAFTALPEEVKNRYAPKHDQGEMFLGYESGKERFKRPDGKWVVDDLKVSYYAYVPENRANKWPVEVDLQTPFEDLGVLMSEMGEAVMQKIDLVGLKTGICLDGVPRVGRMLYYRKNIESEVENPFWCGAHFDHGLFTALLPAFYFQNGELTFEPIEVGLFVRTTAGGTFKKVISDNPEVLLFQVGEFGQLATNDSIKATEHRVHKAPGSIERYTMALFFDAPMDSLIYSTSELTSDERYGGAAGEGCTYRRWHEESFKRYLVKDQEEETSK
jgi:isopenicillin N synthase-like dioxygenase